jgi:hypothetical protein
MANDELYTPKFIFDELKLIFDLDVCAPEGGPLHTPAVEYFDKQSDGLKAKWFGLVWMNPPFSDSTPWVEKWLAHGNGIALTQVSKSRWCKTLWDSEAVSIMLPPDLRFVNAEGNNQPIYMPCVLWGIGQTATHAMKRCGLGNVR